MGSDQPRCPFCGRPAGVVYVSSHYQCAACGQVIEPCCTGEQAQPAPAVLPLVRPPESRGRSASPEPEGR